MIEYECPDCGEPMESSDTMAGKDETCPICDAVVVVPEGDASELVFAEPDYAEESLGYWQEGQSERPALLTKFMTGASMVLGFLLVIGGGLAIHIWTTYLFYEHWGTSENWSRLWAIIAFVSPFLAESVALVACFWWGVWFYILAIGVWFLGFAWMGIAEYEVKLEWFAALLATTLLLVGGFGYFAVDYAISPRPMTAELRKEIDDTATAVVFVISASVSKDPLDAARLPEAKVEIRKRLGKYDDASVTEIRRLVDGHLRFLSLLIQDMTIHLEKRQANPTARFEIGARTHKALDSLPERLKTEIEESGQIEQFEEMLTDIFAERDNLPEDWRERMNVAFDLRWRVYGKVYSDFFGCTIPSQADLIDKD